MDWRLELVQVPVSDVDRAKEFYERVGFVVEHDHQVSDELRFVQLTPPGSPTSIAIGTGFGEMEPGSLEALQLVVADIQAARDHLVECGVEVGEVQEFPWGSFVFFFAYNLIRTIIAQAAAKHGVEPRTISFKGALQTLEAFQPLIDFQGRRGASFRAALYQQLLDAVALHRVADRPDRFEPRKRKRPPVKFDQMMKPRWVLKRQMAKRVGDN